MVSSARPSSSSVSSSFPTSSSCSTITSWYGDCQRPARPSVSGLACVRKCMCVVLNQRKNGVPAACWRPMKSTACSYTSSSMVCMRFLVSGPVSSMRCVPSPLAQEWITPRGPKRLRKLGNSSAGG